MTPTLIAEALTAAESRAVVVTLLEAVEFFHASQDRDAALADVLHASEKAKALALCRPAPRKEWRAAA